MSENLNFNPDTHWLATCECIEDFGAKLGECDCQEGRILPKTICICKNTDNHPEHNRRYIHLPEDEARKARQEIFGANHD